MRILISSIKSSGIVNHSRTIRNKGDRERVVTPKRLTIPLVQGRSGNPHPVSSKGFSIGWFTDPNQSLATRRKHRLAHRGVGSDNLESNQGSAPLAWNLSRIDPILRSQIQARPIIVHRHINSHRRRINAIAQDHSTQAINISNLGINIDIVTSFRQHRTMHHFIDLRTRIGYRLAIHRPRRSQIRGQIKSTLRLQPVPTKTKKILRVPSKPPNLGSQSSTGTSRESLCEWSTDPIRPRVTTASRN